MKNFTLALCDNVDFVNNRIGGLLRESRETLDCQKIYGNKKFCILMKAISDLKLFEVIKSVLLTMTHRENVIIYHDRQPYEIAADDILYITSQLSHSLIYTKNQDFRSDNSLKKWMEELDSPLFFQCHKSYIVNLKKVSTLKNNIIILSSGERIPVSRRHKMCFIRTMIELDIGFLEEK